jgi:hypothetical protein
VEGPAVPGSRRTLIVVLVLLALFAFRLGFGLSSEFWSEDERQTFLVGLRAFAHGTWPYFGPDIVWTSSRLPGALEGLLIAGPLLALRIPEAPFLLLNALTFAALALFAWYLSRRLPDLPRWLIWGWLMTAPWTLHYSTHLLNSSYVLPSAVVFFIGFFEATPALSAGLVRPAWAWSAMGFGLLWQMQFHMSWVLLPAFVLAAGIGAARRDPGRLWRHATALAAGAALPAVLLVPTLVHLGFGATGGTERTLLVHAPSVGALVTIPARFLSFASFELNRFVGLDTAQRALFLARHAWLVVPALFLQTVGLLQPVVLFVTGWRKQPACPDWTAVRLTAVASVGWVYVSFSFSIREPLAHAFYVTLPVATLYAMYCWNLYARRAWFRRFAALALVVNVVFHAGFALGKAPERSLYLDRGLVQQAIDRRDDRLLGNRRAATGAIRAVEPADPALPAAWHEARPLADLRVVQSRWSTAVFGRVSAFDVTIANAGRDAAYVDLQYVTRYFDGAGRELGSRQGTLKEILEPGVTRRWPHLSDGLADDRAVSATITLVGAEKVVPAS